MFVNNIAVRIPVVIADPGSVSDDHVPAATLTSTLFYWVIGPLT